MTATPDRPDEHQPATYLPPAKYTRSGDGAQCCPHAKPVGPGSCEFCWELHEADCELCWARRLARMTTPDRPGLDQLTSDQLDALYARLDELERQQAIDIKVMEKADQDWNECADAARKYKAHAEQTQTWGEQQQARANRYRQRYVTQRERAERAEATLTAIRKLTQRMDDWEGERPAVGKWVTELRAVLDQHGQTLKETT